MSRREWATGSRITRLPIMILCSVLATGPLVGRLAAQESRPAPTTRADSSQLRARVVDSRTGEPIVAALVRAAGRTVQTDGAGRFALPVPSPSTLVRFERLGYRIEELAAGAIGEVVRLAPEPVLLDRVVVEAPRRSTIAAGTALQVGSVGAEALASGAHTSVAEAMAGTEGVSVSRVGAWGARPFLRGLGGERLAILVDGNLVNRACTFGMDEGVASIDPATVERIEILSGPGSALYGSGNIGGVINVVTRRVRQDTPLAGEVRLGASSGTPGGTAGASLGLRQGEFDGALSIDASSYGDYRTPTGRVTGSSFRHGTADLRLGWTPAPAQRLALHSQVYEGRDIGWPSMAGASIPRESRRSVALDYGAQLGRGALDALSARGYVQRVDHEMLVDMQMGGAMPMRSVTEQRSHSTTSGGRIQLRLLPGAGSHIDLGTEVTKWAAENTRWTEQTGAMGTISEVELRTWPGVSIVDFGAFGQGEAELGRGVIVSAGARVDRVVRSAEGWPTTREWVGSGNVGLRVALGHGVGGRLSFGRGYRLADPTELFGLALRPDGFAYRGNPELGTERNRNYEAGLTYETAGLSVSATAFHNVLSDLITPVLAPGDSLAGKPVRSYANLARARLRGVSGGFEWEPHALLGVSGTMTYTRGVDRASGLALSGVPPLEGSVALRISPLEAGWIEVETRAAARQTRNALHIGEPRTPGYGILNARVGLDLAGLRTVVGVDNILDHAYRGHLDPVSLLRPGRSFYLKTSKAFGRS